MLTLNNSLTSSLSISPTFLVFHSKRFTNLLTLHNKNTLATAWKAVVETSGHIWTAYYKTFPTIFCVCQKKGLHGLEAARFRSKRRRTAENVSYQVWPQVSAWQVAYKDTRITSVSCSLLCQEVKLKEEGRLRQLFAVVGLHLLKAAQKRTLKCEILVYARLSPENSLHTCTNFEEEAELKPAINSLSLAADFALEHLHHLCSTNSARNF